MNKITLNDTIAAISTPIGQAGIGIVRLSGKQALKIADKIFLSRDHKKPSHFKTYTTHYGWIKESQKSKVKSQKLDIIDEVILTVMRAPKSYTKENIVEINCHSGIVPLKKILDLVINEGARLAEPGEFTRRAFLNGRIDLALAEAVLDVINATTESSYKVSLNQLKGNLSSQIEKMSQQLLDILAHLEANIDFPEEDVEEISLKQTSNQLNKIRDELDTLLENADQGKILREGINVVICGKPNVGKSSLLNAFLKEERAIVTPIGGTTRDTIEEVVNLKGIPFKIVDTAGIIEPRDLIETEAVKRSRASIENADLILLLLDVTIPLSKEDKILIEAVKEKKIILVLNKIDLPSKINLKELKTQFKNKKFIQISALKMQGLEKLEAAILEMVWQGEIAAANQILVSNVRHIDLFRKTYASVEKSISIIKDRLSLEFVAEYVKEALDYLGQITGKNTSEDLLEKIFREFCIGK